MEKYEVFIRGGKPIKAWTKGVPIEEQAKEQLYNVADLPFIYSHIAVMPDVHFGIGATVGSVIPTKGAIIPAAVGVDIGCGMCAIRTNVEANWLPDNLKKIRSTIEAAVPHGNGAGGSWSRSDSTKGSFVALRRFQGTMADDLESIEEKYPVIGKYGTNPVMQLGSLGGGNHFIEICLDEDDKVWIMLHSGSRGIGNRIGRHFIQLAKEDMERHFIHLPDKNLAYVVEGSEIFKDYVLAVDWAQDYAFANRQVMLYNIQIALQKRTGWDWTAEKEAINCHHNYIARENHGGNNVWVTRKGAVRARKDDLGIIPGSMGAKSFIVRGKGNAASFHSCSHGAGRVMSRTEAKRRFTISDHVKATSGVECKKGADVLDETPGAYKDIDAVMAAQSDLVDIVHTLKQVVCVKG